MVVLFSLSFLVYFILIIDLHKTDDLLKTHIGVGVLSVLSYRCNIHFKLATLYIINNISMCT